MKSSTGPLKILATLENKDAPQKKSVGLNFLSATLGIKTSCKKNKRTLFCYPFAKAQKKIFFSTNFSTIFSKYFQILAQFSFYMYVQWIRFAVEIFGSFSFCYASCIVPD